MKPLHQVAEFCSTCRKVNFPDEVTGNKECFRRQDHDDTWLWSSVSGHGPKSFCYPEEAQRDERDTRLREAVKTFKRTLELNSENSTSYYNLELCHRQLEEVSKADHHGLLHIKYRRNDSIAAEIMGMARQRYPATGHSAEALGIYSLNRRTQ